MPCRPHVAFKYVNRNCVGLRRRGRENQTDQLTSKWRSGEQKAGKEAADGIKGRTEDNCTFHPVTGRAARASTLAFSGDAARACARALPRLSPLGGGEKKN